VFEGNSIILCIMNVSNHKALIDLSMYLIEFGAGLSASSAKTFIYAGQGASGAILT